MEKVLNLLSKSIEELNENNSPIAETITNEIDKVQFDRDINGVSIFVDQIDNTKNNLESIHTGGIEDSLASIKKDLDHVAGQIKVSLKVINAGAGPHKVAEYINNAKESLESAIESIDKLVDFIIGESDYSDEILTDNTEKIESSAIPAKMDLENIHTALDKAVDKLKS